MTIALTACSGPSGTPSPRDAGGRRDPTADTPRDAGDEEGASTEQVLDASDAMQAQVASCVGAATEDASTICSTGSCVQNNWAEWPMPNSLADVGQGAPNASSYTVNGDGTVTDRVTGLVWQGTPPAGPYTWGGAVSYCTSLTLGGQRDWRLPTYVELVSIVDYSAGAPTIDPTAFPPVVRVDDVWTSTLFAADTTTAWEVYFFAGDSSQDPVSGSNDVRCVRGPDGVSTPAVPPSRYAIAAGEVYDTKTGLTWQENAPAETFAWADARAYCTSLNDGGGGWRVPTAKELLTIVDVTRASPPAIDCEAFSTALASAVWSATPLAGSPSFAWGVDFRTGYPSVADESTLRGERCVH